MNSLDHPTVSLDRLGRPRRKLSGERNQCSACAQFFNSGYPFTMHRYGGLCRTPSEMHAEGMRLNKAGYWIAKERRQA